MELGSPENPVKNVRKFLKWVEKRGNRNMLYRGLSDSARRVSCSLLRRMEKNNPTKFTHEQFVDALHELLDRARIRGHDAKISARQPKDLELLAELQHYDAATCLIDFSKNPLVGLYFAARISATPQNAQKPTEEVSKERAQTGKVVALDSGNYDRFIKINTDELGKGVNDLLFQSGGKKPFNKWRIWEPKLQNNRIIAQQSVFVFGKAEISEEKDIAKENICHIQKEGVLADLEKYGVSEESLFCDFHGFSRIRAENKPYTANDYMDMAFDAGAREKDGLAEYYFTQAEIIQRGGAK